MLQSTIRSLSKVEQFPSPRRINRHKGVPLFRDVLHERKYFSGDCPVLKASFTIHQGYEGLLKKADHRPVGALVATAREKCKTVSAEHVVIPS